MDTNDFSATPGQQRKKRIFERVMERIAALIDSGELRQGGKLPPERAMAELFSVSRSAVREAIRALQEQGVLESRHGDGTYVTAPPEAKVADLLGQAVAGRRMHLEQVIQFRLALEPQIAHLAAENATPEDIAALNDCLEFQRKSTGAEASEADIRFHDILAGATGNPLFGQVLTAVREHLAETREAPFQNAQRFAASLTAHAAILNAVAWHEPEKAEASMRAHLLEVERMLNT